MAQVSSIKQALEMFVHSGDEQENGGKPVKFVFAFDPDNISNTSVSIGGHDPIPFDVLYAAVMRMVEDHPELAGE